MPWKETCAMQERLEFIAAWKTEEEETVAELCRRFGITRRTGYKWLGRYEQAGWAGLVERSRAPLRHANQVEAGVEEEVLAARRRRPQWGPRKLRDWLRRKQPERSWPAASTIGAMLQRRGLTHAPGRRRVPRREEGLTPAAGANEVWCADFKGWFRAGDGARCDPFTISDLHSRYLLRTQLLRRLDYENCQPVVEACFREYGLPQVWRTDNGAPFASSGGTGLTRLAVWLIRVGVRPERIEPGRPQQNGRHERLHRTLKQAAASPPAASWRAQQRRFDRFLVEYNWERPHAALGGATPAERYQPSGREFPARIAEIEYPSGMEVRRVSPGGQLRIWRHHPFVSNALVGQPVGLEPVGEGQWRAWFSFYELGVYDLGRGKMWTPAQWRRFCRKGNAAPA